MKWSTGNWNSYPEDGRAFIERDDEDWWWVYQTGDDGRLLEGFPKITEVPFPTVEAAQGWVAENVPWREITPDALSQAVTDGVPILRLDLMEPGEA